MSLQKLKVNSVDRLNPDTTGPENFTIELPFTLQGGYQLHWLYMPLLYKNVTIRNNRIYFRESGVDKIAYLTPGKYTGATMLKTQALAALNAASENTYAASVDFLTDLFTFTASADFEFTFSHTTDSAAEILGFARTDYPSGSSVSAVRGFNLATLQIMNITVNGISAISDTNAAVNPTFTMPILGNVGTVQFWQPTDIDLFEVSKQNRTNVLNIRVVDDHNNSIPLEGEWHMIIKKIHH